MPVKFPFSLLCPAVCQHAYKGVGRAGCLRVLLPNWLSACLSWPTGCFGDYCLLRRGIIPYLEYQSVCPFVRIGFPASSPASVPAPLWNQRGRATLGRGWGGGESQFGRVEIKLGTLSSLWSQKRTKIWTEKTTFKDVAILKKLNLQIVYTCTVDL
jgi:hypothetical protein